MLLEWNNIEYMFVLECWKNEIRLDIYLYRNVERVKEDWTYACIRMLEDWKKIGHMLVSECWMSERRLGICLYQNVGSINEDLRTGLYQIVGRVKECWTYVCIRMLEEWKNIGYVWKRKLETALYIYIYILI